MQPIFPHKCLVFGAVTTRCLHVLITSVFVISTSVTVSATVEMEVMKEHVVWFIVHLNLGFQRLK